MKATVCILVDNPNRDLPGCTLLAWHLAKNNIKAILTPLYNQGFDIPAIQPDMVVMNYIRPANIELIHLFRRLGINICVLDTEGAPAVVENFKYPLRKLSVGDCVDVYCCWGNTQKRALLDIGVPESKISVTGCPRYDFASEKWSMALRAPQEKAGYFLINTAYPYLNPKFTSGPVDERKTLEKMGLAGEKFDEIVKKGLKSYEGLIEAITWLSERFPEQRFVLRPHPFEAIEAYLSLEALPNVKVIQQGTSFEWILGCKAVIHVNCSTAVEAVMLTKPALSLYWLNFDETHVQHSADCSLKLRDLNHLFSSIELIINDQLPAHCSLGEQIEDSFGPGDGANAVRVFNALRTSLERAREIEQKPQRVKNRLSRKSFFKHMMRMILGFKCGQFIARKNLGPLHEIKRKGKSFGIDTIRGIVDSFNKTNGVIVNVDYLAKDSVNNPYIYSGQSIVFENEE